MTKKEIFARMLTYSDVIADTEAVTLLEKEIERLSKARTSKAKTAKQAASHELMEQMVLYLEEKGEPVKGKELGEEYDVSPQRVTALMKMAIEAGFVEKIPGKTVSYKSIRKIEIAE